MKVDAFTYPDVWYQAVGFKRAQQNEYRVAVILRPFLRPLQVGVCAAELVPSLMT